MEREWTKAQLKAITEHDKTLLISAAAGSGKTATLTERIIRSITAEQDPADISKMLIVTYTRSAAAELKTRIFAALSEALAKDPSNRHLTSQLMKIGSAKISTIDAFYLDVVKSNFSTLGFSANFRIIDEAEYDTLSKKVMCECIEALYAKEPDFPAFIECFGTVRTVKNVHEVFLALHSDLSYIPQGVEYIRECAVNTEEGSSLDFFATPYGEIQRKNASDIFEHYYLVLKAAMEYMQTDETMEKYYGKSFAYDFDYCERLCSAVSDENDGYAKTKALLESYAPIRLGSMPSASATESSAAYKQMRTAFTKKMTSLREKSFSKPLQSIQRAMRDTAKNLYILYELMSMFDKRVTEEKDRLSLYTFVDISRAAMKLFVAEDCTPTELARKYSELYTDIYIDEYQDVDMVQDLIFRSISRPKNRFMVGDIKQSIYSFRGAEPKLFSDYRRSFPSIDTSEALSSDTASIFMSDNFRCDANVIKFTNEVCSVIFSACSESIGYTEKDDLGFSKKPPYEEYQSPKVKVAIVTVPENEDELKENGPSGHEREAEYIAAEIERLIKNEKKANGEPICPGDVAVLFRSKKISPVIAAALEKRGILASESDSEHYFEDPDVLMMLCILNAVDNPERDIYLTGALRSPIFNFDMDELIRIRHFTDLSSSLFGALKDYAAEGEEPLASKCRDFVSVLDGWQKDAAALSVDRFIRLLYDSERFIASGLVSQTDSKGEGGNLLMLYEYARKFENGSFKGLYQFIEYLNSVIENGGKLKSDLKRVSSDRVSLMTIHKSKGLEFPVCFVVNTASAVTAKETRDSMVFDYPSGIAFKLSEQNGIAYVNTPMREAILANIANKHMEEEMRVLYVALTRARERLYLTASCKNTDSIFKNATANATFPDRYNIVRNCSSYLDWVLLATHNKERTSFDLEVIPYDKIPSCEKQISEAESTAPQTIDCALTERLREEFNFTYKYASLSRVPSKLSVSRLYPDVLDENDTSATLYDETVEKAEIPVFFAEDQRARVSRAERGTATHLFLQFCDFKNAYERGVDEELSRLLEKKFLPGGASELIYKSELEAFMKSELIGLILSAKSIIREQRFNVELSAKGFTSDEELLDLMQDEKLAVQGVIDLIIIDNDGNLSLFDYKTDRLTKAELSDPALAEARMNETHGLQLSYYAKAIEHLFGRKCARVSVYSTHAARLFEITPQF